VSGYDLFLDGAKVGSTRGTSSTFQGLVLRHQLHARRRGRQRVGAGDGERCDGQLPDDARDQYRFAYSNRAEGP
jgi:hypothetical protein